MKVTEPAVTSDDFVYFLYYLVREVAFEAEDIVHVVEKPWKYQSEYHDYLDIKKED